MRRSVIVLIVLAASLAAASSASAAAVLTSAACNRWIPGSRQAGSKWVPVAANGGLLPSEPLRLTWTDGSLASATAQSDAAGHLFTGALMPSAFITTRGPHVRRFGLAATDANNGTGVGLGRVTFVRVDAGFQPRRGPHEITRYALWGAPAGRRVWMHFFFGGRQRRTIYMGRADRPCGVVKKRLQILPARSRYGTWKVYLTNFPRTPSARSIRRRDFLYRLSFNVYRIFVPRAAAAKAALR